MKNRIVLHNVKKIISKSKIQKKSIKSIRNLSIKKFHKNQLIKMQNKTITDRKITGIQNIQNIQNNQNNQINQINQINQNNQILPNTKTINQLFNNTKNINQINPIFHNTTNSNTIFYNTTNSNQIIKKDIVPTLNNFEIHSIYNKILTTLK